MKKLIFPAVLVASLVLATACGDGATDTAMGDSTAAATTTDTNSKMADTMADTSSMEGDKEFAMKAANGGMTEVEAGKLAAMNASAADVKKFGQQMVTDHTKANDELKALAATKNIMLPPAPDEEHQKKIDDLKAKKGAEFDKAYVSAMVEDHEKTVSLFEKESSDGKDAELKAWAMGKVPTLKHHLDMIKAIKDKMKD